MKEIYPDYASDVDFYAVGTDPFESIQEMEAYREEQGYPWPIAYAGDGMLADFRITSQSTKVVFDSEGIIVYRDTYGRGDAEQWRSVFEEISGR